MTEEKKNKEITLNVALQNVGKHAGGKYNPKTNTTTFSGIVSVSEDVAEDLLRREKEYLSYETSLIRNNGSTAVNVGNV